MTNLGPLTIRPGADGKDEVFLGVANLQNAFTDPGLFDSLMSFIKGELKSYLDDRSSQDERIRNAAFENGVQTGKFQEARRIAHKIMEFDEGCATGKRRFLEFAGIEIPIVTYRFTVDVDVPIGADYGDVETDIRDCINSARDNELIDSVTFVDFLQEVD